MNETSIRSPAPLGDRLRANAGDLWTWALCLGVILFLAFQGGGYDPLVDNKVALAVWWVILLATLVGAVPRGRLQPPALGALALLAGFTVWTALSLDWTESSQRTWADVARVTGYLGVFTLAVISAGSERGRAIIGAVTAAIFIVAAAALLSRLHPAWFPHATVTARLLNDPERLSYPLDYWNAVGLVVAIGIPLLLHQAAEAGSLAVRAVAAAAVPALPLTIFFTLSRSGIAAAALAVALYLAFAGDRLPKLATTLAAGVGSAVLLAYAAGHDALRHGLDNAAAHSAGDHLLLLTIVVCAAVGIAQLGIARAFAGERPAWMHATPRQLWIGTGVAALIVLVAALGLGAPGKIDNAWGEFKEGGAPGSGTGRLGSLAGESRYQFWGVAAEENASKPLTGTGSGTFEFWWDRKGTDDSVVRDTHSLWMQTLGELGIVGLVLLVAFLGVVIGTGAQRLLLLGPSRRSGPAVALAGILAFCFAASVDWMWQMPAVAAILLLLCAALVGPWRSSTWGPMPLRLSWRLGAIAVAIVALVGIALPLAATTKVRESETLARGGDLAAALGAARSAQNVLPGTAGPRLQEALVLESMGRYDEAAEAAQKATEREKTNWRNFLVLARVEAEAGRTDEALAAFRQARSLYPRLPLFSE